MELRTRREGGSLTSRPHLAREARPAPAQPRAAAAGPRDVRGPASEPGGGGAPGEAALVAPEVGLQPAAVRVDTAEHPVLSSPPVNGIDSLATYCRFVDIVDSVASVDNASDSRYR